MAISIKEFTSRAAKLYTSGRPIEITGAPGSAKTSSMRIVAAALSKSLGVPFGLEIHELATLDTVDIRGYLFPSKEDITGSGKSHATARFTYPTVFPKLSTCEVYIDGERAKRGEYDKLPKHGIVFLDEFPQADQLTQKAVCSLILEKRVGAFRLPGNWIVWAAGNRMADKAGVVKRLSMLQNRITTIETYLDYASWEPWANQHCHPLTITFAKRYPSIVFIDAVPGEQGPFCTARSLAQADALLMSLRDSDMPIHQLPSDTVAMEIVAGTIGDAAATEFMTHIRIANDLPDIDIVAAKPETAKVPERADGQFIMASMLAHHVTKKNGDAFLTYMMRLSEDVQVLFVRGATQRNAMILGTSKFSSWISKNQVLLNAANMG